MPASVYLVRPLSRFGRTWLRRYIDKNAIRFGDSVPVEWRYLAVIIDAMEADGLRRGTDYEIAR